MLIKTTLALATLWIAFSQTVHAQEKQEHQLPHIQPERDYNAYPIDPRKPCHICSRPDDCKAKPIFNLPALRGRPHIDQELGGCRCGQKCVDHHPMKSWNWPQPFSALRECKNPALAAWLDDPCRKRFTNLYDQIGDFRLIDYKRNDNGYCGPARDPYGCLGESRQLQSNVRGLQFRQPGEPVFGSPALSQQRIPAPTNIFSQTNSAYPMPTRPRATKVQPVKIRQTRVAQDEGYNLESFRKR